MTRSSLPLLALLLGAGAACAGGTVDPRGPGVLGQGNSPGIPAPDLPPPLVTGPVAPPTSGAVHTVVRGDTLWGLAQRYCGSGHRWRQIYQANQGQIRDPHWIYPGQRFVISCGVTTQPWKPPTPGGQVVPFPAWTQGRPLPQFPPMRPPGIQPPGPVRPGTVPLTNVGPQGQRPPGGVPPWPPRQPHPHARLLTPQGQQWMTNPPLRPEHRGRVTSHFNEDRGTYRHRGIDYGARRGSPIFSVAPGVVTQAGWVRGYGYVVYVRHPNGLETRYAHMAPPGPAVRRGQRVNGGQFLGPINSTGNSTGDHLHFEVRRAGQPMDPAHFCRH